MGSSEGRKHSLDERCESWQPFPGELLVQQTTFQIEVASWSVE